MSLNKVQINSEDGGSRLLRNAGKLLPDYKALQNTAFFALSITHLFLRQGKVYDEFEMHFVKKKGRIF
jgi:hypothetical protein